MRSTGSSFFCVPARRTRTRICLFVPAAAAHSPTFRADWPRAFFPGRIWPRADRCLVSQCSWRLRPHFVKQRVYPAFQASQLKKHQHAQCDPFQRSSKLQNLNDHFLLLPLLPILLRSMYSGSAGSFSNRLFSRVRSTVSPVCRSMGIGRHGRYHPSVKPCGLRFSPSLLQPASFQVCPGRSSLPSLRPPALPTRRPCAS